MASYMDYPGFGTFEYPGQQQCQPHAVGSGVVVSGTNNDFPFLIPYGSYYPLQAAVPDSNFEKQASCYGPFKHYLMTSNRTQYMAVPPGLAAPIQSLLFPPLISQQQVTGGVSEVLDYDLETMTSFVVQNVYLLFANENFKEEILAVFNKGVSSVLNATRLPSISIFFALDFLAKYLAKLPLGMEFVGGYSINFIYQNLMVAFVLANKFNDDKTFTNKSWSHATGMKVELINTYEREWLSVFEWKLFDDRFENYESYRDAFYFFVLEEKRQKQATFINSNLSVSSVNPSVTLRNINYSPQSLFPTQGFQIPISMKMPEYSSPLSSAANCESYSASYFPPIYSSPISNVSSNPKGFNKPIYHPHNHSNNGLLSSAASSFFECTPFDGSGSYKSSNTFNSGFYCYSAAY